MVEFFPQIIRKDPERPSFHAYRAREDRSTFSVRPRQGVVPIVSSLGRGPLLSISLDQIDKLLKTIRRW